MLARLGCCLIAYKSNGHGVGDSICCGKEPTTHAGMKSPDAFCRSWHPSAIEAPLIAMWTCPFGLKPQQRAGTCRRWGGRVGRHRGCQAGAPPDEAPCCVAMPQSSRRHVISEALELGPKWRQPGSRGAGLPERAFQKRNSRRVPDPDLQLQRKHWSPRPHIPPFRPPALFDAGEIRRKEPGADTDSRLRIPLAGRELRQAGRTPPTESRSTPSSASATDDRTKVRERGLRAL